MATRKDNDGTQMETKWQIVQIKILDKDEQFER